MRLTTPLAIVLEATLTFAQPIKAGGFDVRILSACVETVSGGDVLIAIAAAPSVHLQRLKLWNGTRCFHG